MTTTTLYGQATQTVDGNGSGNAGTIGLHFTVSTAGTLGGIWLYSSTGCTQLPTTIALYTTQASPATGTLVTSQAPSWSGAAGSGWVFAAFTSPPTLSTGTEYMAAVFRNDAVNVWFLFDSAYTWPKAASPITAPKDTGLGQGWFDNTHTVLTFPASQDAGFNWYVDVSVVTGTTVTSTGSAHMAAVTASGSGSSGSGSAQGDILAQDGGQVLAQDGGAILSEGTAGGVTATGSASMASVTAGGSGAAGVTSSGSASMAAVAAGGSGTQVAGVVINGSASLGAMQAGGTGAAPVIASGSASLAAMRASGTGAAPVVATGSASLAAMAVHGTNAETITTTGSASLAAVKATGTAAETIPSTGSARLASMTAGGTAVETVSSAGSVSMATVGAGGTGAAPVVASGSASLSAMRATGTSGSGSVTVAGVWASAYSVFSGYFFPYPAARPVQIAADNTAGDWLFALVAWRPTPGTEDVSVCVADDAHNWWEPVGAPTADSGAAGAVRVAVWAAPAARVADPVTGLTNVQVAATGSYVALAAVVVDMAGLLPWYQVAAIGSNFSNAATGLSVSAAAPGDRALLFSVTGSDNNSITVSDPAGWTELEFWENGNGVDHSADIMVRTSYQVTTGAATASVTASGAVDLAGVIAGVIVSAPQPAQASPNWPVMTTEVAIGAGIGTPPSEMTWTPVSGRSLSLSITQGKQYSLGQLQAGTGTILLDDPDGALIPPGTGAYAGIDSGTPIRRRVTWAGLPGSPALSPNYVAFAGYVRRWPWNMDGNMLRGQVQAEITDAWGYGNGPLNAMAIEEAMLDEPNSLWPLTDAPGSTGAGNLVANGPPLNLVVSKFGAGGAVVTWGANSGALLGMSSAQVTASGIPGGASGMFEQELSGQSLASMGFGYALTATSQAFPPVSGGVTMECVAQLTLGTTLASIGGNGLFQCNGPGDPFNTSQGNFPAAMPVTLGTLSGGTFPAPFTPGGTYFVVNPDGSGNYSLAATAGGTPIAVTTAGITDGTITPFISWNPAIMAARALGNPVCGLEVNKTTGALTLRYRPAGATVDTTVTVDTADYRESILAHYSLSFTQTTWRVLVNGGRSFAGSGTFSSPLPASFTTACYAGVMDRTSQGLNWPGYLGGPAGIYAGVSQQVRVIARYLSSIEGLNADAACDRVERLLEYGGIAGRRWLGQQVIPLEGDLLASGQDVGGQAPVSSVNNLTASTAPALAAVAPTGDIFYLGKLYTWNQGIRWTLGDDTGAGEIPFQAGNVATDYDPSRVTADVQLTQLDSQAVTTPDGVMSATTMPAVAKVAGRQYGGQPYQQTGYLEFDWSSPYDAGGSLVDLANWVQAVFAKPQNRVQSVTVDAASHPAAWPFWAGAAVGDMVQVNLRVPTASTSPLISLVARITQTARSSQFSQDGAAATIAATLDFAPEYNALTCDDPVRGLLDGETNVLPW